MDDIFPAIENKLLKNLKPDKCLEKSMIPLAKARDRGCHPEVFCKNVDLRNFAKFIVKHLCKSHFLNIFLLKSVIILKIYNVPLWMLCAINYFFAWDLLHLKKVFTPCKAEQLPQGMQLQEKEVDKDEGHNGTLIRKSPKKQVSMKLPTKSNLDYSFRHPCTIQKKC